MKTGTKIFSSLALVLALQAGTAAAAPVGPSVKFHTLKEAVAKLLPDAKKLTQRDVVLSGGQLKRLKKYKNWDTDETQFTLYHARNEDNKIVRTLVLFPEYSRQGGILVAVALSNGGRVVDALLMEAENPAVDWLLPLLRAGYMETFSGQGKDMGLALDKKFKTSGIPEISQTYALHIANAVKKSAQLFYAVFGEK